MVGLGEQVIRNGVYPAIMLLWSADLMPKVLNAKTSSGNVLRKNLRLPSENRVRACPGLLTSTSVGLNFPALLV